MVGKLQTKSSNKSKDDTDSVAVAETSYLKIKNQELAKALAQAKSDFTQVLAERDYLQRELFSASTQIKKLETYIDVIENSTKNTFNKIVGCSNDVTTALQTIHLAKRITKKLEDVSNASILQMSLSYKTDKENKSLLQIPSTNSNSQHGKTHAVKPMVSGHVIFRPTINLRRVNEEEIERSLNVGAQQNVQHNSRNAVAEETETQETDHQQNSSFRCRSTSHARSQLSNGDLSDIENISDPPDEQIPINTNDTEEESEIESRLQTLQEEVETSEPSDNLEPLNERETSRDMMIALFNGVKLFTYNSQNNNVSNLSCNADSSSQIQEDGGAPGRVPMVTTHRGTGERPNYANLGSTSNLSYSVGSETTLLSRSNRDSFKTATENLSEPSTSGLRFQKSSTQKNVIAQNGSSPRNNSTVISESTTIKTFIANGSIKSGPNVVLENLNASEISKLQQLSVLGLEPTTLKNNTSTPYSPAVKTRRRIAPVISPLSDISQRKTQGTPRISSASIDTTPQRKKSQQGSRSFKNKKQVVLGNPTVILKRLTMPKRNSKSPPKKRGTRTSKRTSSMESNDSSSTEKKTHLTKRSLDKTPRRQSGESRDQTPKRRKASSKQSRKNEVSLLSPQRLSDSPIRPRRRRPLHSFKEPSINRKMRRSK